MADPVSIQSCDNNKFLSCRDDLHLQFSADAIDLEDDRTKFKMEPTGKRDEFKIKSSRNSNYFRRKGETWILADAAKEEGDTFTLITIEEKEKKYGFGILENRAYLRSYPPYDSCLYGGTGNTQPADIFKITPWK